MEYDLMPHGEGVVEICLIFMRGGGDDDAPVALGDLLSIVII